MIITKKRNEPQKQSVYLRLYQNFLIEFCLLFHDFRVLKKKDVFEEYRPWVVHLPQKQ
jgi:hypothetical protein